MLGILQLSAMDSGTPNPSVLLALNLAGDSSKARQELLERIKETAAKQAKGRRVPRGASQSPVASVPGVGCPVVWGQWAGVPAPACSGRSLSPQTCPRARWPCTRWPCAPPAVTREMWRHMGRASTCSASFRRRRTRS